MPPTVFSIPSRDQLNTFLVVNSKIIELCHAVAMMSKLFTNESSYGDKFIGFDLDTVKGVNTVIGKYESYSYGDTDRDDVCFPLDYVLDPDWRVKEQAVLDEQRTASIRAAEALELIKAERLETERRAQYERLKAIYEQHQA